MIQWVGGSLVFSRSQHFWWSGLLLAVVALLLTTPVRAELEIEKSPNDPREYRYLELENGLRTMLISDPATDKAAASLNVHVGSGSDPRDRQGLAHFLEHMLFLGTDKYPEPGEYQDYIRSHGGSNNAFTSFEDTNYFFDVNQGYLEPALDRFARFFVAPLFSPKYVEREKHAVNSEYQLKLKEDSWRYLAVFRAVINPEHPYSKFSVGSLETLEDRPGEPVRKDLLRFYRKHYVAGRMTLVVLGREPLDQLQSWVAEKFSVIPGGPVNEEQITTPLFGEATLPARVEIEPVEERQRLKLIFPVPSERPYYRAKPMYYIANLIGHEGEGSLLAALKAKRWVDSLGAGQGPTIGEESTFEISMKLTDEGRAKIPDIIDTTFQAIRLIAGEGIQRWLFDEQRMLAEISYRFRERSEPMRYVTEIAGLMWHYPANEVLRAPYVAEDFDPDLIERYIQRLTPENLLLFVTETAVETDRLTPWFEAPYRVSTLPEAWIERWHAGAIDPALSLPAPNPFIPEDLTLRALEQGGEVPVRIEVDPGFDLWFRQDADFREPRANFYMALRSPIAFDSPEHLVLTKLYLKQVRERLRQVSYPAYLAGLEYSVNPTLDGILVQVAGYNDKLIDLLQRVTVAMAEPRVDDGGFDLLKSELDRELENDLRESPYVRALSEVRILLLEPYWTKEAQLEALRKIGEDTMREFVPELLETIELEALAHGNLSRAESLALAETARAALNGSPPDNPLSPTRVRQLASGTDALRELSVDHGDSALVTYHQGAKSTIRERARYGLLAQIIATPFYQELRTEQQLGYVVFASASPMRDVPGVMMAIQSPNTSPASLEMRVREFLTEFEQTLHDMPQAEVERQRRALVSRLLERPQTLTEQTERYWSDITEKRTKFDTRQRLAETIGELGIEDIRATFAREILGPERRRLVVAALGNNARGKIDPGRWAEDLTPIDPIGFKRDLDFHEDAASLR